MKSPEPKAVGLHILMEAGPWPLLLPNTMVVEGRRLHFNADCTPPYPIHLSSRY